MPANQQHLTNHCGDSRSIHAERKNSIPKTRPSLLQEAAKPYSPDFARKTTGVVRFDCEATQSRRARRSFELRARQLAQEAIERLVLVHPYDGVVISSHADVRHKRSTVGQNAIIGCWRVGMGANDKADAAIGEISHRLFLAGSLTVEIDNDCVRARFERTRGQLALDGSKGIVEWVHKNATHRIDYQRAFAVLGVDKRHATAGRSFRIVEGTDQAWRAFDEYQRFALIPGVVAKCDGVNAGIDQLVIDNFGDAKTAGGIFAIEYHQVELPIGNQPWQPFGHDRAPRAADHVADKKDTHAPLNLAKINCLEFS